MFVIELRFGENKGSAPQYMDAHNSWISAGFESGMFQLVGSIVPPGGGVLLALGSREAVEQYVSEDPFVANRVVSATVTEVKVGRVVEGLEALS